MPRADVKNVLSQLKKGELRNIYYICGSDINGVESLTKKIIKAVAGDNDELAVTKLDGKYIDPSELYDQMQIVPMMSEYNCIFINDYDCERPYYEMNGKKADDINKRLFETLKNIPEQTVIIFNVTGFEIPVKFSRKIRDVEIDTKNKNRKLADIAEKNGILCIVEKQAPAVLAKTIAAKVSARGGMISVRNAQLVAEICTSDEIAIGNEIDKLCAYAGGREITETMIRDMVHYSSVNFTVYNLADAIAEGSRDNALNILSDLDLSDDKKCRSALSAIQSTFMDYYRVVTAKRAGVGAEQVINDFGYYSRRFIIEKLYNKSIRLSLKKIRSCLDILCDTNERLNSTAADIRSEIETAVIKMLTAPN